MSWVCLIWCRQCHHFGKIDESDISYNVGVDDNATHQMPSYDRRKSPTNQNGSESISEYFMPSVDFTERSSLASIRSRKTILEKLIINKNNNAINVTDENNVSPKVKDWNNLHSMKFIWESPLGFPTKRCQWKSNWIDFDVSPDNRNKNVLFKIPCFVNVLEIRENDIIWTAIKSCYEWLRVDIE